MPPQSTAMKRITREIKDVATATTAGDLPPGCMAGPSEASIFEWTGSIQGPPDSPYEGGVFDLDISLPSDYPFRPPRIVFKTKIYHCNINAQGGICLDILKNKWSPALSIVKVLLSIASLLADPNPADPLVPDIAVKFQRDRKGHDKTAKSWVDLYAKPKLLPKSSSTTTSKPKAPKGPTEVIIID